MKRDHLPGVSNYSNYNIDNYLTKSEKMLSHSFCLNKKMKHEIRPDVSGQHSKHKKRDSSNTRISFLFSKTDFFSGS